jgi:ESX-1-secreted protein regulator
LGIALTDDKHDGPTQFAGNGQAVGAMAPKIEWLIRHMWPRDVDLPRTDEGVAKAIREITGEPQISRTTIWKLRSGRTENPTFRTLRAIATFFRIPISYFGDDEEADKIKEQLERLALFRDAGISRVMLRTLADLSPEGQKMIGEMIESVARMELNRTRQSQFDQPASSTRPVTDSD